MLESEEYEERTTKMVINEDGFLGNKKGVKGFKINQTNQKND